MQDRSTQNSSHSASDQGLAAPPDARPLVRKNQSVLRRTALNDFLSLCTGVADVEDARLARQYTARRAALVDAYERMIERIEQHHQQAQSTAVGKHETLTHSIREQYDAQIAAIGAEYLNRRARVVDDMETALRDTRKSTDQEIWLAESVSEATGDQIKRNRTEFEKHLPSLTRRIDEVAERADWVLAQYGYRPTEQTLIEENQTPQEPDESFDELYETALQRLHEIERLSVPAMVVGSTPYVLGTLLCLTLIGLAGGASYLSGLGWAVFAWAGPVALGLGIAIVWMGTRALTNLAQLQMKTASIPLRQTLAKARLAIGVHSRRERERFADLEAEASEKCAAEVQAAKVRGLQALTELEQRRAASLKKLEETLNWATTELAQQRDAHLQRLKSEESERFAKLQTRHDRFATRLRARRKREIERLEQQYTRARRELEDRWHSRVTHLSELLTEAVRLEHLAPAWSDLGWQEYRPSSTFTPEIRFGQLRLDLNKIAPCVRERTGFDPGSCLPERNGVAPGFTDTAVPAVLELPERCSLLLQYGQHGRDAQIAALQAAMTRLLTSLPAGRVHFTIIDPVGLGENFAGFMHMADYDEALVGGRIWTEKAHIEQRLGDLTAHMENVIQKYLRNEFETIDAYNIQAGELAEPYRFLVICDFPANFTDEAVRRLGSIVSSGPRCGVYTLIAQDTRIRMPSGVHMEDVERASVHIRQENGQPVWQDDVLRQFPLALDTAPDQELLTGLMHKVGQAAGRARRVEVPFEFITPSPDQIWSGKAAGEIRVPIGRTGAVRLQELRLGRGVAQHALIAGKTGSGKSTLLHVMITNLVLWYPPDEVEFYLIDFKKGVEFKTYATHELPHARAIAIESDREFGLSVLQRIDAEMERRGELFRAAGVQDMPSYRATTGRKLPRTLLVVDEFQIFFSEDDKISQDTAILLDRLVRQGRAFGIHVLLGSQTLGGTAGLARSTIGQMAIRIALQCSEIDSQMILEDGNSAARLLSRPGEAIYNDAGGLLQGNSPFQTAWLSDEIRDGFLDRVTEMTRQQTLTPEAPIVFEGNAPADLRRNRLLADLLGNARSVPPVPPPEVHVWLGEAVAIKNPTAAVLRRQSGSNLLLIGQRDDAALALLSAGMIGLGAQHSATSAEFVVLDGSSSDSPHALQRIAAVLPQRTRFIEYRATADIMMELADELHRRQNESSPTDRAIYMFIHGLQRYRTLRRNEDSFSFSCAGGDENKPPAPDKLFTELLREGPSVGIHILAWADTPATVERTFDRQTVREFDNRVLFQMSAADSSNLIDSPMANRLGFYRALFFSEEQGLLEKFRPYSLPDRQWLDQLKASFANRTA